MAPVTSSHASTLIFVPGAWHTPSCFSQLIEILGTQPTRYKITTVTLPSVDCTPDSPSMTSWQPDIDTVRGALLDGLRLDRETSATINANKESGTTMEAPLDNTNDNDHKILLISHSYGSIIANEALQSIPVPQRPRVKHLIMCGFVLDTGMSIRGPDTSAPYPRLWKVNGDLVYTNEAGNYFYHDLPEVERSRWERNIGSMPLVSFTSSVQYVAWKDFSTTYLVCEDDRTVVPAKQVAMLAIAKEKGVEIEVETVFSGHSPFLSVPDQLAKIIQRLAAS